MNWIFYALIAIVVVGVSDVFRKLATNDLKNPIFINLVFQTGSYLMTLLMFLSTRQIELNKRGIFYAFAGGVLVALFSTLSFKALSIGPGVSTVMPALRVGGITLVVLLGILLLKERLTVQTILGLVFSAIGIYLIFTNK